MSTEDEEDCVKYPFLPKCKRFVEGMDITSLENPKYQPVMERAFERLEQAMESGLVSKTKITQVITEDEKRFHEVRAMSMDEDEAAESWNVLFQVYEGKIRVVKT